MFAATAASIFPNPVAGGLLGVEIAAALGAAAALVAEAEAGETSPTATTVSQTATSTSSTSETPTTTEYVVALNSKWPDFIVGAFLEAFPENGTRYDFNGLGLDTFVTNLSGDLADILSVLPIFTYIVPNRIPQLSEQNLARRGATLQERESLSDRNDAKVVERRLPLHKRANTPFPYVDTISVSKWPNPPEHLRFISSKDKSGAGEDPVYLYEASAQGSLVNVYVVDSGFGNVDKLDLTHYSPALSSVSISMAVRYV